MAVCVHNVVGIYHPRNGTALRTRSNLFTIKYQSHITNKCMTMKTTAERKFVKVTNLEPQKIFLEISIFIFPRLLK